MPAFVLGQYPAAGATGVPRNTLILLRQDTSSGLNCSFTRLTAAGEPPEYLSERYGLSEGSIIERISSHRAVLLPSTTYTVTYDCQPQSYSYQFTTGAGSDLDAPRLLSISPDPAARDTSPYGPFTLRFSKPLAYLDQAISISGGNGETFQTPFRYSADRQEVQFRPQYNSFIPHVVVVRCNPAKVVDLNNNPGVGLESTTRFLTFLVKDGHGPQLLGSYPDPGEADVPTNAQIQLLFDRPFGSFYFPPLPDDAVVLEARGVTVPVQLQSSGNLISLKGVTLLPKTPYRLRITPKLLDSNGVPVSEETSLEFTTGASADPGTTTAAVGGPQDASVPLNASFVLRSARRLPSFAPQLVTQLNRCSEWSNCVRREVTAKLQEDGRTLVVTPKEPLPSWSAVDVDFSPLADITGASPLGPWRLSTTDQTDTTPPDLTASSPSDDEAGVRVNSRLRFLLNEPVGLMTPASAVRLTTAGQIVAGRNVYFDGYTGNGNVPAAWEFVPFADLAPGTDYEVELVGVADTAGNVMPARKIRFRTATDSPAPAANPTLVSTSLDSGLVGAMDPLVLESDLPMGAARMTATVLISPVQTPSSAQQFYHPLRVEVSGTTTRIVPLLPWPAKRTLTLNLTWNDQWGRYFAFTAQFQATSAGDIDRPEVVSVTPAPGTPILPGQAIQIRFSKPMLDASQINGGLTTDRDSAYSSSSIYWSGDRTMATLINKVTSDSNGPVRTLSLAITSALTDLSGNAAKAFTAVFPLTPSPDVLGGTRILKSWPLPGDAFGTGDVRATVILYLSAPVSAETFNRSVWITTDLGRASGSWIISADGRLATFQPDQPWPAGSAVRLMQVEPVLSEGNVLLFQTKSNPVTSLSVIRTSLTDPQPANAVIDIEFNQALPSGPGPLRLRTGSYPQVDIQFDELRPSPNVLRLVPRSSLPVGDYLAVNPKTGSTLSWYGQTSKISPALNSTTADVLYRSPLPDSSGVARNARVSLVLSSEVNEISASLAKLTLSSGGTPLLATLFSAGRGARLTLTPLAILPANARIDVSMAGLEDRLGRPIPTSTWSFTTGDSIDLTAANLLYSSANSMFDPLARLVLTFDEPIDPAFSDGFSHYTSPLEWSLSSDLRSLSLLPAKGWSRGESISIPIQLTDWTGNFASVNSLDATAGFEPDSTPPALRAVSVLDGQRDLPLNTTFALLFNKPLGSAALRSVRLTSKNGEVPLSVGAWYGNRVTLTPRYILSPLTRYQLIIEGVQDASGNLMAERAEISFETGESLSEAVVTTKYRFESVGSPLTVRFSQPIDGTRMPEVLSVLFQRDSPTAFAAGVPIPVDLDLSGDRTLLTITPRRSLELGITYTIQLTTVTGSAGGALSEQSYTFTAGAVVDSTPTRVTLVPEDGSTGVPLNVLVSISFSRTPSRPPAMRLIEGDKPVAVNLRPWDLGSNPSKTFILDRQLKPNQRYRIEVDGFRDALDNDIPPSSATFTTGADRDFYSFAFVSSSPLSNEAGVAPDTPWVLTFNRPLMPVTPLGALVRSSRAIPYTTTTRYNGAQATIIPEPSWPAASAISLSWTQYSGLPTPMSWVGASPAIPFNLSFRTAAINDPTPPVLESIDPPSGSTIPGGRARVTLRFSKPVMIPSDSLQVYFGATKSYSYGTLSSDFRTLNYILQPPANSRVTIVGTADIRDNADNPLAPFVVEYDTGENAPVGPPTVTRTEPPMYTSAPADAKITIRFDRAMAVDSVLAAFHVTQNGQNVSGSTEVLEGGRTYRFTPAAPFSAGAQVKVFLLKTAVDTSGVPVGLDYQWPSVFTVAGTPANPLSLHLTRRGFSTTAPADSTLEFELSQELDPTSVNGDSVWLRLGSRLVPGEVSLRDRNIVQFHPQEPLAPGSDYVLTAGSALRDLNGQQFRGQDLTFRAVPVTAAATDLESATEIEWEGRRAVRVRFTGPLSPLAAHGLRLDRDGSPVDAEVLPTTDSREFVLIPGDAGNSGSLHINLERVPEANGKLLPFRRMATKGPGNGQ
jgi:hypothetical protein